jgi:hypothetical protein
LQLWPVPATPGGFSLLDKQHVSVNYYIAEFLDVENCIVEVELTEVELRTMIAQGEMLLDSDEREV